MKQHRMSLRFGAALAALLAALFAPGPQGWQAARANATALSTQPIFISTPPANQVKPNIMMVLDDSGSMNWDYMPDVASRFDVNSNGNKLYGFPSSQCNGMYYNPNITYTPPVDATGVSYPTATFTSALKDGFNTGATVTNLSSGFQAFGNDTAQPAYYYTYSGTQTAEWQKKYYDTSSIFYKECTSPIGSTTKVDGVNPVNTVFTKVVVSATSGPGGTDERANFANWYSYYRTRILMMKTATGLAFKTLDNQFRVGFMTLNNNNSSFLNIADFDATQKGNFYGKLYGSSPNGSTPLREALANAGRIYAGKVTSFNGATVVDPVQYSCQQNYTILSTDGFWNGRSSDVKQIDGVTTMGNEDGQLPRPFYDGSSSVTTVVTPYTSTKDYPTTTTTTTTTVWTQWNSVTLGSSCTAVPTSQSSQLLILRTTTNWWGGTVNYYGGLGNSGGTGCTGLPGGGYFCQGTSTGSKPISKNNSTKINAGGNTWYLVTDVTTNPGMDCMSGQAAFGAGFSPTAGVCREVAGQNVTGTASIQPEVLTNTQTSLDRYSAQQSITKTYTNGVLTNETPLTPANPTYTLSTNLSVTSNTTDSCGGTAGPCPATTGTWSTPATLSGCMPSTLLPATSGNSVTAEAPTTATSTSTGSVLATSGPTAGTPTQTTTTSGGTTNTLADVAAYYYFTKLRTTALGNCTPTTALNDLCLGGVPTTAEDPNSWQHMTTFTLGLGTRGRMVYKSTYVQDALNKAAGDYTDIYYGNAATSSTTCTWRDALTTAGAACNWPVPGADQIENVDDMWHAAVNGHGKYYSAADPGQLAVGLAQTLMTIVDQPKPGTAASAATTNPKVTQNNNYQFSSFFLSVEWSGDLIRQTKDLVTGLAPTFDLIKRVPGTYDWSAREQLDVQNYTTRRIYTSNGSSLVNFDWTSLQAAGLHKNFLTNNIVTNPPQYPNQLTGLSQFCATGSTCLSATDQTNAAGLALVNFLRGDRSNEEGTVNDPTKYFRHRAHVLGDIVSAQPQYSGAPSWSYTDSGYAAFKTANASRRPLVFAAANDGMLHAIDASNGAEVWGYVPSYELPRLYTLADKQYASKHQYFVEGTPQVGDICPNAPLSTCSATQWKTIIVGGLNAGGTGYYALDITDPNNPALLWEFSDPNMGYTFGNPQIVKLDDGTWVVLVTSGYNNCPKLATAAQQDCAVNGTGDGMGHLYVLKAATGQLLATISTLVGSQTGPSGLSKIAAQVDSNAMSTRVYGGDLYGNLWRFNIGSGGYSAQLLATLKDGLGNPQAIMEKPQTTMINGLPVVYVGTGRYLSTSDVTTSQKNSFYAIKDRLGSTSYGDPRTSTTFTQFTAVDGLCPAGTNIAICNPGDPVRTVTQTVGNATDSLVNKNGWILDFPAGAGEIEFTDPKLVLGTLFFTTSIPAVNVTADACVASANPSEGLSFLYMLDYLTGNAIGSANGVAGASLGQGIATSPQFSQLQDGRVIITTRMSGGNDKVKEGKFNTQSTAAKRVSWRELLSE